MGWSNYTYREPQKANPGNYRCIIMNAEQKVSKSGKNMLQITVRPSGTALNVNTYIVDGDYFDDNLSRFLDAFPALKEGLNIDECFTWRGQIGAARFGEDDRGYLKVSSWMTPEKAESLPEFEWKARDGETAMPEPQVLTELPAGEEDDTDFPF